MKKLFLSMLLCFPALIYSNDKVNHPIYVSILEIEHNETDNILEVSCKIFSNDFESVLRRNTKEKLDLINPSDKEITNRLVSNYIQQHVKISVNNGKSLPMKFLGYEQADESIESYFQIDGVKTVSNLTVEDDILYEYMAEQMDIIHVIANKQKRSTRLYNPEKKAVFSF